MDRVINHPNGQDKRRPSSLITLALILGRQAARELADSEPHSNAITTTLEESRHDQRQTGSASHTERGG